MPSDENNRAPHHNRGRFDMPANHSNQETTGSDSGIKLDDDAKHSTRSTGNDRAYHLNRWFNAEFNDGPWIGLAVAEQGRGLSFEQKLASAQELEDQAHGKGERKVAKL